MITVKDMIEKLEKVENKEMEMTVRVGMHLYSLCGEIFECESDGIPFICIDSKNDNMPV